MAGQAQVEATAYGGGVWEFTCCCSALCNAGFKCVTGALGSELLPESSDVKYHRQCPAESAGCYSITASGEATGWRVLDEKNYKLVSISDPRVTATVVFETSSGRPPDLGEEMTGHSPTARVSTDSWPRESTSVQFIDTSPESRFPYEAVIKAWGVYARAPGTLRLLVWRLAEKDSNKYTLVGENTVSVTDNFGQTAIFLSNSSGGQLLVQEGDMIGWAHVGPGYLEWDDRPDKQKLVRFIYGSAKVGDTADFTLPDARRYSIRAYFDPTPNSTSALNSAPLPVARGCYQRQLGRFGLRCRASGALAASVSIAGPPLPHSLAPPHLGTLVS